MSSLKDANFSRKSTLLTSLQVTLIKVLLAVQSHDRVDELKWVVSVVSLFRTILDRIVAAMPNLDIAEKRRKIKLKCLKLTQHLDRTSPTVLEIENS